jgi:predicted nuclease of predicted toxin-antitoxin system
VIRIVLDVSLSPAWVDVLAKHDWPTVHWSAVGDQVRAQDVLPQHLEVPVIAAIRTYESQLQQGALVTIDEARGKVRMLPIGRS